MITLKDIDLFINIVDEWHNGYVVSNNVNYDYKLIFKYENWTGIIGDGYPHIAIIAEYVDKNNAMLVKFADENLQKLLLKLKEWNEKCRTK